MQEFKKIELSNSNWLSKEYTEALNPKGNFIIRDFMAQLGKTLLFKFQRLGFIELERRQQIILKVQ